MEFEWDPRKDAANQRKHGISFREAVTVFQDFRSCTFADEDHSVSELRFITIGTSASSRVLVVAHTERGDSIRIISCRRAMRRERLFYEENQSW